MLVPSVCQVSWPTSFQEFLFSGSHIAFEKDTEPTELMLLRLAFLWVPDASCQHMLTEPFPPPKDKRSPEAKVPLTDPENFKLNVKIHKYGF